jgi:transcriptional regulator with XRE-family HTH domain
MNCTTARLKKGLTQQEMAKETGIAQPRIAQIELGNINITFETAVRIAHSVDSDLVQMLRSRSLKIRKKH